MRRGGRVFLAAVFAAGLFILPSSCRKHTDSAPDFQSHPAAANVKRYSLHGTVLATSAPTGEITIKHGDIPGFMPAMTMPYKLKNPDDAQRLRAGDEISADVLVPSDSDDYLLDKIFVGASGRALPPRTIPPHQLMIGEQVPDVPLVNQDGRTIRLGEYRGKAVLVTFIYTRCPMPKACPLITSHFAKVNAMLSRNPRAYASSHLISISLDPIYDKPSVLRQYGLAYLDDNAAAFSHWEFADTTPDDLKRLAAAFGLQYSEENNQITHTMQTTLIGPDNKVAQVWPGSGWDPNDVAHAVEAVAMKTVR